MTTSTEPSRPPRTGLQTVLIVAAIAAGLYVLYRIEIVILALIMAMFFAYLIAPLVFAAERLLRTVHTPRGLARGLAIGVVYLGLCLTLGVGLLFLLPKLSQQATDVAAQVPEYVNAIRQWGDEWVAYERALVPQAVRTQVDEAIVAATDAAVLYGRESLVALFALLAYVPWLVLIPVLAFFQLKDLDTLRYYAVHVLPAQWRGPGYRLAQELNSALAAYMRAQLLACAFIGTVCWLGFLLLGVPYAALLGVLAGVLEFIPLVGPLVVAVITAVIAAVQAPVLALLVTVFLIVLRIIEDYVVYPRLMGRGTHLHPLAIILAVLIGVELGGIVGVFLSVPVVSSLSVTYRHWVDWNTRRPAASAPPADSNTDTDGTVVLPPDR